MRLEAVLPGLAVFAFCVSSQADVRESWNMRDVLHRIESHRTPRMTAPDTLHDFDVLAYDLKIRFDLAAESIGGTTSVLIESDVPLLDSVSLDLVQLSVDRIWMGGRDLGFAHAGGLLQIGLDTAISAGDTFGLSIAYHGQPGNEGPGGFGGFWFAPKAAYSMGVGLHTDPPSMGRYWFPCYDSPHDKAEFDMSFTVPLGKVAVSNGVLVDTIPDYAESTMTYIWAEHHPTSTYLVAVSISNYAVVPDSFYPWIRHYVYPEDSADAVASFKNVHTMMDAFENAYSAYKFDRFSFVETPKGDMEHQTCVSHLDWLINGLNDYDWVLAHEMAHHWWGDWVTVGDWRDIWLNEGFATYSEAVYWEYLGGWPAYHDYVVSDIMNYYLASGELFPIYDPLSMWGATSYEKGASVLHMLRHVVTDSVFFDILDSYGEKYSFSYAVTPDFQAVCESIHGQDLDWFFSEWIYDWGYPKYTYTFWQEGTDSVRVVIGQEQFTGPTFVMPVDLRLGTGTGDTTIIAWVDESPESLLFVFPGANTAGFALDPDDWILKMARNVPGVAEDGVRRDALGPGKRLLAMPNPFADRTSITVCGEAGRGTCGAATLSIHDLAGRTVKILHGGKEGSSGVGDACRQEVVWDGTDESGINVPSGVYMCVLRDPSGTSCAKLIRVR